MRSDSGYLPSVPVRGGVGSGQGDVGVQLHGVRPLSLHNSVRSCFKFACKINSHFAVPSRCVWDILKECRHTCPNCQIDLALAHEVACGEAASRNGEAGSVLESVMMCSDSDSGVKERGTCQFLLDA